MRKDKPLIEIRIGALVEGINKLNFHCKASDFSGRGLADAGFGEEVAVEVIAEKSDAEIIITINTSALGDFFCDRCLTPVSPLLTGSLDLLYTFDMSFDEGKCEVNECRSLDKNTEYIDITEDTADALILSLPMKVTCGNNADCQLYGSEGAATDQESHIGETNSWQESLEKLKKRYC
jgi:uncharacterized protein